MTVYHNGQRLLVPVKTDHGLCKEMYKKDKGLLVYAYPGGSHNACEEQIDIYIKWWQDNLNLWIEKKGNTNPFGLFENKHNKDI